MLSTPKYNEKGGPYLGNVVEMNISLRMYTKYRNEQPHFLNQAKQFALEPIIFKQNDSSFTILF